MRCAQSTCRRAARKHSIYCLPHLLYLLSKNGDASVAAIINSSLKSLPYRSREMVKLYTGFGDGYIYKFDEIARIFKVQRASAKSNLARSLRRLDVIVDDLCDDGRLSLVALSAASRQLVDAVVASEGELIEYFATHPNELYRMPPRRFEELVADILRRRGFVVDLTRFTKDGGRDILACIHDGIGVSTKYIVECKRYSPDTRVGIVPVRALYGVKGRETVDHALLATTSTFTRGAIEFAHDPRVVNLHLRDFHDIVGWLRSSTDGNAARA